MYKRQAFNIGVELGQLTVLLIAFIMVRIVLKGTTNKNVLKIPASVLIGAAGLFWFFEAIA